MTAWIAWIVAGCFFLVVYAYAGYPVLLTAISWFRKRPVKRPESVFPVTFIITAHNEEGQIGEKLENTLALDYPRESLEILVASDGSTDRTDEIVREFGSRGVELVAVKERLGKENAQREAIGRAKGEILVFSDAGTRLDPDGLRKIVRSFADATVGCVSSEDRVVSREGKAEGEGVYVRYEMLLRQLESRVGSLVGLSGSLFAARRDVCQEWAVELPSDFNTVAASVRRGLRGVSDPEALGYYAAVPSQEKEFRRKVRTVLRGMTAFFANRDLWNPFRYGLFSWQLWSHKLCRWLVPVWLVVALGLTAVGAAGSPGLRWLLAAQVVGYGVAAAGIVSGRLRRVSVVRVLAFFVLVNAGIAVAWWKLVRGERAVVWAPSQRDQTKAPAERRAG